MRFVSAVIISALLTVSGNAQVQNDYGGDYGDYGDYGGDYGDQGGYADDGYGGGQDTLYHDYAERAEAKRYVSVLSTFHSFEECIQMKPFGFNATSCAIFSFCSLCFWSDQSRTHC